MIGTDARPGNHETESPVFAGLFFLVDRARSRGELELQFRNLCDFTKPMPTGS